MHTDRRQVPRLTFTHQLFRHQSSGKVFGVADISMGGMSLRIIDPQDLIRFTIGTQVDGLLQLWRPAKNQGGERFPVHGQVVAIRDEHVGLEFKNLDPVSAKTIERFLDPTIRAQTLRRMPVSTRRLQWFHGDGGLDLYVWMDEANFEKANRFCLMTGVAGGAVVMGESSGTVRTGLTAAATEAPIQHGVVQDETQGVRLDTEPDALKLAIAKHVILSSIIAESLKKELTAWIETLLSNSSE